MKKPILIFIVILIAVFAALSVAGAGGEYAAEKMLYYALKANEKIVINPDLAPPAQIAAVEFRLKELLNKYPASASAKTANVALLEFYIGNKKYEEAKVLADKIINKYKDEPMMASTAQFLKGTIYEKTGNWDRARAEFKILNERYPATQLGMEIPLYIGTYYHTKAMDKEAREAYQDAAAFYKKMEIEYSGKVLGYTALTLEIRAYLSLRDYEAAGNTLEFTIRKYTSPFSLNQLLPLVEKIYVEKLNNTQKALDIYQYAKGKTTNRAMLKLLDQRIKKITSSK